MSLPRLPPDVLPLLDRAASGPGRLLWVTGAGISAESGIPTFRGKEGYWTVGSRNYHPQELATQEAFRAMPDAVWSWYLYRRAVCRAAAPNDAHEALSRLEARASRRHLLVTQNVDGLHLRAGSSLERTYQVHGNIDFMRCADECAPDLTAIPNEVDRRWERGRQVGNPERAALVCKRCGGPARPHVLWFDEVYDEARFRFQSSLEAALAADLLVVVGSAGTTNLPMQIGMLALRRAIPFITINADPSPFTEMAELSQAGAVLAGRAGKWVPLLAEALGERLPAP